MKNCQDLYYSNCITDKKTGKAVCPLKNVEISAFIDASVAEVTLTQNYINTSHHSIEALYTFPVPHDAQVTGFKCRMGSEEVTGEFREKEEAFREYDNAVQKGDSAFLLESRRPDIFQISLGNIAAGETASVVISYLEDVKISDRELRWSLPTVVAPRYIPGNKTGCKTGPGTADPTDQVPDADYITPPVGDATYTLKIKAVLKGINGLKKVSSPSHPADVGFNGPDVTVTLARENEPLDRDFIISAQLEQDNMDSFVISGGSGEMFGSVSFCPDLSGYYRKPVPCEYVFLIDISGSMGGEKLKQAKRALAISLRNLFEGDYFNIVAFESSYRCFANKSLPYSQSALESADKWISSLTEMGGTEIYEPLKFVLEKHVTEGLEKVVFLFTDGQVGNENQIISLAAKHSMSLKLYPFGIDTAVNRYFIDRLARSCNGMPEYIYPGERIEDKVIRQFSRVHQPYLVNLSVTGGDGRLLEAVPALPARLYDSEGLSFTFRSESGGMPDKIKIRGSIGEETLQFEIEGGKTGDERLLSLKWAKDRIMELESMLHGGNERRNELIRKEITQLSLKYSVLSTLTSLVAVYTRKTKAAGLPQTVVVPVAAPRDWTMPLEPNNAYSFAPMCVTEACMRSYPQDMLDDSKSPAIPPFLKKGRTASSRSGHIRLLRKPAEKPVYSVMPEALDEGMGSDMLSIKSVDAKENLHEMILRAAQLQNAAGAFGNEDEAVLKTSCFIIGMLLSGEEWKPYRLQLIKARDALMKLLSDTDGHISGLQTDSLFAIAAAALAMFIDSGLLRHDREISVLKGIVNGLPGVAADLFNAVLSGSTDKIPDPDGGVPSGNIGNKERAARYLHAVINQS